MKKYVKPELFFESYELSQNIAACGWDMKNQNQPGDCKAEGDPSWGNPNILVLTAAGIAGGEDVYNTIIAGADATGSSSGVAKAADRPAMVDEMIAACRKAWDDAHSVR